MPPRDDEPDSMLEETVPQHMDVITSAECNEDPAAIAQETSSSTSASTTSVAIASADDPHDPPEAESPASPYFLSSLSRRKQGSIDATSARAEDGPEESISAETDGGDGMAEVESRQDFEEAVETLAPQKGDFSETTRRAIAQDTTSATSSERKSSARSSENITDDGVNTGPESGSDACPEAGIHDRDHGEGQADALAKAKEDMRTASEWVGESDMDAGSRAEREVDEGPADEALKTAIREEITTAADIDSIKPKQMRSIMEERFSCSLNHRKAFVKKICIQACQNRHEDESATSSNSDAGSDDKASDDDDGRDSDSGVDAASASVKEVDGGDSDPVISGLSSMAESASEDDDTNSNNIDEHRKKRQVVDTASSSSSSSSSSAGSDAEDKDDKAKSQNPPLSPKDTDTSSSASSSSEAERDISIPVMPRPQARATSARRALARAKLQRTVRKSRAAAKAQPTHTSTTGDFHSASASDSDSDSDLSAGEGGGDGGRKSTPQRRTLKLKKKVLQKKIVLDRNVETSDEEGSASKLSGMSNNSNHSISSRASGSIGAGSANLSGFSSASSTGKRQRKMKVVTSGKRGIGHGGQARKQRKPAGTKRKPKSKVRRKGKGQKLGDGESDGDDGLSGLVDSDDEDVMAEGRGRGGARAAKSVTKSVVQEELDDANEEKMEERQRIAAERQRQLDSLRVMDAAQLKEATRAAQGTLLAKIKERQARVNATLAATAKEELKRLKAEARKAHGMLEEEEEEEEEEDVEEQNDNDEKEEVDEDGVKRSGQWEGNNAKDIEGMVAMEEEAVAAAAEQAAKRTAAADGYKIAEASEDRESDDEEAKADEASACDCSRVMERARFSEKKEGEEESEESSESDSGEELEILPAPDTAEMRSPVEEDPTTTLPISAFGGERPDTPHNERIRNSNNTKKHSGGGDIATRAIAALPKGMRFSSPKTADKSRAANRRRLTASARAVANDRWAAQLGYQDGEEHIRDLKYTELKRRQQAQHERARKEKEAAVMAARLIEYAKHADEDERQLFGDAAKATGSPATDAVAAAATTAAGSDTEPTEVKDNPESTGEEAESGASTPTASATVAIAEGQRHSPNESEAHASAEAGQEDGQSHLTADVFANNAQSAATSIVAGDPASTRDSPEPRAVNATGLPPTAGDEEEGIDVRDTSASATSDEDVTDNYEPTTGGPNTDEEKKRENTRNETTTDPEAPKGSENAGANSRIPAGSDASAKGCLDATKNSMSAEGAAPALDNVRPPVVKRTYGRKSRDVDGNVVAKPADLMAATVAAPDMDDPVGEDGGKQGLSADSQALWMEEPDSVPSFVGCDEKHAESKCVGSGGDSSAWGAEDDGFEESWGLTLELDNDDDAETLRPEGCSMESAAAEIQRSPTPATGNGSGGKADTANTVQESSESGANNPDRSIQHLGTKRKLKLEGTTAYTSEEENNAQQRGNQSRAPDAAESATAKNRAASSFAKMKISADGSLAAAPVQKGLGAFFNKDVPSTTPAVDASIPPLAKKKKSGIVAFFGASGDTQSSTAESAASTLASVGEETRITPPAASDEETGAGTGENVAAEKARANVESEAKNAIGTLEKGENEALTSEDNKEGQGAPMGKEDDAGEGVREEEEPFQNIEEAKDRSAKFRAMLEAERLQARRNKKLRKAGMMDEEAEEEEEEEAVRGLGDFGFGVAAGGNGTSAAGTGGVRKSGDDEEEVDEEIREEDLEGIVDTFSDDEGDKAAQDRFLNNEAAAGDRQALKDMVRRVREGFGDERGGRGRGSAARGNLRLDELTAADRSSRKEARRLGLLNSDEEWSDDEKGEGEKEDDLEELDEQQLGELLAKEQRARHMGLSQTAQEYLESSDSEGEGEGDTEGAEGADVAAAEEAAERREEERLQKMWVKRAKRRRVLAEVEQGGAEGDSQGPELLLQEDEDSQAILSLLQCTNSRMGLGLGNSAMSMDGSATTASTAIDSMGGVASAASASAGSKRRGGRDDYSGELDAREVANGFGMGMSSKPLKRAKSDGSDLKDVTTAEARARMDRAFTMPQFVTSTQGFGGSSRAKQTQRKGSFLSRAGSLQSRSGSLASGKTTVSASKFVFMSSSTNSMGAEDCGTRTGFEEPAARDPSSGAAGGSGGWSTSRPPLSASGANMGTSGSKKKAGTFSGIGGSKKEKRGGVVEDATGKGRLWKGLCAGSNVKSRR